MRHRARLPPSASISFHLVLSQTLLLLPSRLVSRLSFPSGVLRRARSPLNATLSLFARRIQFLPSYGRTFNLPRFCRRRVASAYRFRCAPTPERAFVLFFSISRARPRDVFVRAGIRVVRTADQRDAAPYQSLPPGRAYRGPKPRIIVNRRGDGEGVRANPLV